MKNNKQNYILIHNKCIKSKNCKRHITKKIYKVGGQLIVRKRAKKVNPRSKKHTFLTF